MISSQTTSSVNIEIIPSLPKQESVLANLLELYIHDFSEFMDLELNADGRFGYRQLPLYWKESSRHPFFIWVNEHLAGFVLLQQGSQISGDEDIWDMTEFFIVRRYRRLGVGLIVAHKIWKQFPGKWQVRVMDRNQKAREFWTHAIREFLSETIQPTPFKKNGEDCHVFSFESPCADNIHPSERDKIRFN